MTTTRLRARAADPLPVAALVIGQPVAKVAALLPRIFNLCRAAQMQAISLALGQPCEADVKAEILRDHLLKLCVTWPAMLEQGARPLPASHDPADVRRALFGPNAAPLRPADHTAFLHSDYGIAPVLRAIKHSFTPGEATCAPLPSVTPQNLWHPAPVENSVATRHLATPALRTIEISHGRGPLWRAMARLLDVVALLDGALPAPLAPAPGQAMVSATRGAYGLHLRVNDGLVTGFARVTPTDSLLAPGGILDQSLNSLDAARAGQAALLLDILDPCAPVTLEPAREDAHA